MHSVSNFQNLSLEKKIGQMFFIGLPCAEIDEETIELLNEVSPGGICLFARNIRTAQQTRGLLENLRESLPVEPFLSLDQEGGLVDRLRRIVAPMPSASKISQNGNVENAKKLAQITAEVLGILGFNMNFAPVVDLIDEPREKFSNGLFSRAFGKSKDVTVEFASAYLETLQTNNCLGCLKHFPGIGAAEVDSHEELPLVNLSADELFQKDLFIYRELFKRNEIHAVMVGHSAYPEIDFQETDRDGKFLPSSLSSKIIKSLLREELDFQNLVITDDLEMGAIVKNYGIGEAAKMALKAGNDFLCICANPEAIKEAFRSVKNAIQTNEISEKRLDESLERIWKVKKLLFPPAAFDELRLQELSEQIKELNDLC